MSLELGMREEEKMFKCELYSNSTPLPSPLFIFIGWHTEFRSWIAGQGLWNRNWELMKKLHVEDEGRWDRPWFGRTRGLTDLVWWPIDLSFGWGAHKWVPLAGRHASHVFSSGMAAKGVLQSLCSLVIGQEFVPWIILAIFMYFWLKSTCTHF